MAEKPKRYGIQTAKNERFNIYTTDKTIDMANKSEDQTLNELIANIKTKLTTEVEENGQLSIAKASELMAERLIVNAEAQVRRTTDALRKSFS